MLRRASRAPDPAQVSSGRLPGGGVWWECPAPALWAVLAPWWRAPEILLGSWPPSEAACRQSWERSGFFWKTRHLAWHLACWGSAEWRMGAWPTALPTQTSEAPGGRLCGRGGAGEEHSASALLLEGHSGGAGPPWWAAARHPCSRPLLPREVYGPAPCLPRGTPGEEVTQHKGAADLFSFALPWPPIQATHSRGDSWESSHCPHP